MPPGSAIFIDQNRAVHEKKLQSAPFRPCIFEYIYFARPDSYLNKINVYQARVDLGKKLARVIQKSGLQIDVVVPVPDSSRPAAIEIARLLKLKYREGLVKNRYIGRTFIMPGDQIRQKTIRHKLNPIADVFQGKNVLIVDDSIVRGNTSRSIIQMVRQAGARNVYFVSYSAPLTNPCVYGIDMQTKAEFIASDVQRRGDRRQDRRRPGAVPGCPRHGAGGPEAEPGHPLFLQGLFLRQVSHRGRFQELPGADRGGAGALQAEAEGTGPEVLMNSHLPISGSLERIRLRHHPRPDARTRRWTGS